MIQAASFHNFRGFEHLELSGLTQLTLFSGKNNTGKSTVLEGVFLFLDHMDALSFVKINSFRDLPILYGFDAMWKPLFHRLNAERPISISMKLDGVQTDLSYYWEPQYSLPRTNDMPDNLALFNSRNDGTLGFKCVREGEKHKEIGHFIQDENKFLVRLEKNNPDISVLPMPATQYFKGARYNNNILLNHFTRAELNNTKVDLVHILQEMDSDLLDVITLAQGGQTQLYARTKAGLLPLKLTGDGMNRLIMIMLAILENHNAIILLDEIENGFHYSMYPILWKNIAIAAKISGSQVIATTHSYECIVGAIEGVKSADMTDNFSYFRMAQENETRCAHRFSGSLLQKALDAEMEVR